MLRRKSLLGCILVAGLSGASPSLARADWELKRRDDDPKLWEQMKEAVRRDPHDGKTLARLLAAAKKKARGVDKLLSELGERPADQIVRGRILLQTGKRPEAKAVLEKACPARDDDTRCWLLLTELVEPTDAIAIYERLRTRTLDASTEQKILRELVALLLATHDTKNHAALLARLEKLAERQIALGGDEARRRWADTLQKLDEPGKAALALGPLYNKARDPMNKAWLLLLEQARLYEAAKQDAEEDKALDEAAKLVPRTSYLYRELTDRLLSRSRRRDELRALGRQWEQSWPKDKRNFVEWEALGRLYDELGDSVNAETALNAALKADPRSVEVWRRLIQLHDRHAQTEQAIAAYRSLIKIAPGEPRFRLELAERLHQSRALPAAKQEALRLCKEVSKLTRDPGAHVSLADLYTRWGYLDLALAERKLLEQLEPQEESHRVALGEIYYQKGDKAEAIEIWRSIANQAGKKETQLGRVAEILAEHDELPLALETFRKAREQFPNDLRLLRGLASALERAGQANDAEQTWVQVYERALAAKERAMIGEARHRLVQLQNQKPSSSRAANYLRRADTATDEMAIAGWVLLAVELTQHLSSTEFGLRAIAKHIERIKDNELRAELLIARAMLLRNQGRPADAIAELERASELDPTRKKELLARSAELSLLLYRDADALSYAKRAVEAAPNDPSAHLRLAEVHLKRDETELAIAAYERAIALDPRQWKIYFELSRLHVASGAPERAAQLLRQVMRRAPDEQFVLDAARRAVDLEEYLGSLAELEKELSPLMLANPERREYRALLIDVYERLIRPLSRAERAGDAQARATLNKLADRAQRPLLDLLIDGDGQQQALAVALLGELGGSGAATPLLKLALSSFDGTRVPRAERDGSVKAYTLRLDAALAGAQAATLAELPLLEKLSVGGEKHFRIAAYLGLGRLRDANGAPRARVTQKLLIGIEDEIPEAGAAACLALGQTTRALDGVELQRILLVLGETTRPEVLRAGCATALGKATTPTADERAAVSVLQRQLIDGGELVARQAAWALQQRKIASTDAAVQEALLDAALTRGDSVRPIAMAALREPSGSAPPVPRILRNTEGVDLRGWLVMHSRPPTTLPDAWDEPLCQRQAATLQRRAPTLLARHEDVAARTLQALGRCASSLTKPLPAALASALVEIAKKKPALAEAANHVQRQQTTSASPSNYANSDWWIAAVESPDWKERLAATESSATLPPATTTPGLVRLLRDRNGYVREGALRALVGRSPATADLAQLVDDPAPAVRIALIEVLRPHPQGAALLGRLAQDRDAEVRKAAKTPPAPPPAPPPQW